MSLSDVRDVAEAAGVRLIGTPGEVVALEDCETFLAEAAARELIVPGFNLVEVLDRGGIRHRLEGQAFETLLTACDLLGLGLLAGRRRSAELGDPRLGVEFSLMTRDELDRLAAEATGVAAPKRRPVNWCVAPELMLIATAVGVTVLLIWSVTTALTCGVS